MSRSGSGPVDIPPPSMDRLAIHTITTKAWDLPTAAVELSTRGIKNISVWTNALEERSVAESRRILDDHALEVPALVRGGFFPAQDASTRTDRIAENHQLLQTAAELRAAMVVLVVGAVPGLNLADQRAMVRDGVAALLPEAESLGVLLAIEPLHPMYAADRSCINRMAEARRVCEELDHPNVGIALDVYHTWWDPDLETEIALAGWQGILFAFHVCDWRVPTRDMLNDRALMGQGCIDLQRIRSWVEATGFDGAIEVEIFSDEHWAEDPADYLDRIVRAYRDAT